jgi:hypothetical protein
MIVRKYITRTQILKKRDGGTESFNSKFPPLFLNLLYTTDQLWCYACVVTSSLMLDTTEIFHFIAHRFRYFQSQRNVRIVIHVSIPSILLSYLTPHFKDIIPLKHKQNVCPIFTSDRVHNVKNSIEALKREKRRVSLRNLATCIGLWAVEPESRSTEKCR